MGNRLKIRCREIIIECIFYSCFSSDFDDLVVCYIMSYVYRVDK